MERPFCYGRLWSAKKAFYAFFCPSPCPLGLFAPSCPSFPLGSLEQVRLLVATPPQLHSTFIPSIEEALLNV